MSSTAPKPKAHSAALRCSVALNNADRRSPHACITSQRAHCFALQIMRRWRGGWRHRAPCWPHSSSGSCGRSGCRCSTRSGGCATSTGCCRCGGTFGVRAARVITSQSPIRYCSKGTACANSQQSRGLPLSRGSDATTSVFLPHCQLRLRFAPYAPPVAAGAAGAPSYVLDRGRPGEAAPATAAGASCPRRAPHRGPLAAQQVRSGLFLADSEVQDHGNLKRKNVREPTERRCPNEQRAGECQGHGGEFRITVADGATVLVT
jgi:hypothetical protein